GEPRTQLEEERARDHALVTEDVADLAHAGAAGDRDRHRAAAAALARLEERDQEPGDERRRGQQQKSDEAPGVDVAAPVAWPPRLARLPLARLRVHAVGVASGPAGLTLQPCPLTFLFGPDQVFAQDARPVAAR